MKTLLNSVSIIVLTFALAACATPPPPLVKAEDMPKAYQAPATEADKDVTADWWKSFSDQQLTSFIDEAHAGNLDIETAIARVEQAQAKTGVATADLMPSVSATSSVERDGSRASTANTFGLKGSASYELDIFGKNTNYWRAARNTAKAAIYYRDSVKLTTEASVADAYFTVLALRQRIDITRNNVEAAKRILAITQAKVTNGVLSNLDLAQQTSTMLGQEANIPKLVEQEREELNALAILLGRMPGSLKLEGSTLEGIAVPVAKAGLPATLLVRRPDVAQAEANLLAAHANLDAARAAFLPTISLSASGGWSHGALTGLIAPETLGWSIGASLVQSIFDGGNLTSQRDYYKAYERELVASYRSTVLSALSDTETGLGSVSSYAEQERLTTEKVKNSAEAFRISELQYREGVVDLLTVLDAQQTLFTDQDSLVQIKLSRLEAGVGLYKALGGGWDVTQEADAPLRNTFVPVPDFTDLPIGSPF
jgi:NodT family efflux transporter outer membrane factor (OMF) lipoprotein